MQQNTKARVQSMKMHFLTLCRLHGHLTISLLSVIPDFLKYNNFFSGSKMFANIPGIQADPF